MVMTYFYLQKLCNYNIPLIDLRTVEEVGTIAIGLTLDDLGPKRTEDKNLLSTYSDIFNIWTSK